MKKVQKTFLLIGMILCTITFSLFAVQAQTEIDTTVFNDPGSIVSVGNIDALSVALTLILTFFSGIFPGIKNVKQPLLRAISVGILVVAGVVQTKFGWFTEQSMTAIINTLIPTFAYSGLLWQLLKVVFGFFNVDLPSIQNNLFKKE